MVTSEVEIVNLALMVHLGGAPLVSLDDADQSDGPAAVAICALQYPQSRDALLRAHPWNFATRRAALALLADAPLYTFSKAYALPEGPDPLRCLRVLDTNLDTTWGGWSWAGWDGASAGWPWPLSGVEGLWQVEGRTLVSNAADLQIRYGAQVLDVTLYPPDFVAALAADIAASIAFALTKDNQTAQRLEGVAARVLAKAKGADTREGSQLRYVDTTLTEVRLL